MDMPRLRRSEVPGYMLRKHGIKIAVATLNKMATVGGGPPMEYFGRIPYYRPEFLDVYAAEKLSKPVNSTAERGAA
ncbi:MAG: hypothetical protein KF810_17445 [Rhizobiaceae bacterium]|nr:hypothetical protein [Rhizobiaceae bacterium]